MKAKIEKGKLDYPPELKNELDGRYGDYKSGKAKTITAEESKMRIQEILNRRKK